MECETLRLGGPWAPARPRLGDRGLPHEGTGTVSAAGLGPHLGPGQVWAEIWCAAWWEGSLFGGWKWPVPLWDSTCVSRGRGQEWGAWPGLHAAPCAGPRPSCAALGLELRYTFRVEDVWLTQRVQTV